MSGIYSSDEGRQAVHVRYSELLERWPVPCEQRRVATREGETFLVACGPASAPALLLLQGSGANAAMWMRDVTSLAEHHRVFAVDVIGEPGFSAPSRPPLGSDAYALWLDDVIQAVGLTRASFLGVSLGGSIVLDYAMRRPDRVEKVVVVNPSGIGGPKFSFMVIAGALMLLGHWGRRKAMALAVGPAPGRSHPLDRDIGRLAMLIARHFRHRRARVPIFRDEDLSRLAMPVLAILGARDALLDAHATKRRLEQFVRPATVRWLPGAGHVVRDQASAILEFLGDRSSVGAHRESVVS
jgi:pimeloyl-ACP methyl ester carboxylesterase